MLKPAKQIASEIRTKNDYTIVEEVWEYGIMHNAVWDGLTALHPLHLKDRWKEEMDMNENFQ